MTISLEILIALSLRPDGEAPIDEVKDLLVQHASSPQRLARLLSEARSNTLLHRRRRDSADLFGRDLVERPRPGVWRITAAGRQYLSDYGTTAIGD